MADSPKSNPIKISRSNYQATYVSDRLQKLYQEKQLIDIIVIAGIDRIAVGAHRVVLSASSEFFRVMFLSLFKEAKSESIELGEVDGETLRAVIDFMYSASIELHIETVEKLLKTAHLLELSTLTALCCDFMAEQLDPTNCIGIAFLADKYDYTELCEKSLSYALTNFKKVFEEEEFLKLSVLQLKKLLDHNLVAIPQEKLFLILVAWFKHDERGRAQLLHDLLSEYINFGSLDQKSIMKYRKPACKLPDCAELIFRWLNWHLADEKEQENIIYTSCMNEEFVVRFYCPRLNKWKLEDWPQPKQKRLDYSSVMANGNYIIAGGMIEDVATSTVECLDTQTMVWSSLPPMEVARSAFAMAELNGHIFTIGGKNQTGCIRSVEKFNFETSKWENLAELPLAFSRPKAAALSGKLYVLGDDELSFQVYDPATVKWTQTASKTEKSSEFGLVAVKGHLYVIGGKLESGESSKTVERYNPLSNTWTVVEPMAQARRFVSCCAWNNKILACGGWDKGEGAFKTLFEYDCRTRTWKSLADCALVYKKVYSTHSSFTDFLLTF